YATGSVSGKGGFVGGLVGKNSNGSITDAYATGAVSGSGYVGGVGSGYIGGLLGSNYYGSITSAYWDTTTSGQSTGIGKGTTTGATGLTTAQMQQSTNFTGFDFGTDKSHPWMIYNGHTTPLLTAFMTPLTVAVGSNTSITYDGTAASLSAVGATYSVDGGTATTTAPSSHLYGSNAPYGSNAVNAGTYTYQNGALWSDQQGYIINANIGSLTITPKAVSLSGVTADNKVYDGSTSATLNDTNASVSGFVTGHSATLDTTNASGTFASS
ncbi:hypothetical protein HF563_01230, partial [Acidithiobacillus ferridurans]|nr:hypothetical protein [Acidithiobacillus ferridurans]